MYTCVRAIVRPRGENSRMSEATVNSEHVRALYTENTLVHLILTHPAIDHEVSLNLTDMESVIYALLPTVTVDQWLHSMGNRALPVSHTPPKKTAARIKYNDAFNAGYTLTKVHPTAGAGHDFPEADLTDIRLTKSGVDYQQFYESCLVTVNGLLHLTDHSVDGVFLKDAGRSATFANKNHIGLISFRDVGTLSFVSVVPEMLKPLTPGARLSSGFTLALPDVDLSNQVVMLSIGGYLHFANQAYRVTGDHSIQVLWGQIPFAHRYYDTNRLIDLSAYDAVFDRNLYHGDALDLNVANTDVAITAYMTLPQTFVVLLEADHVYHERHALEATALPGRYYAYERPDYPLQLDNGLLPAYQAHEESGMYSLAVDNNLMARRVHDTHPITDTEYYNAARISSHPYDYSAGYLLEMGRDYLS